MRGGGRASAPGNVVTRAAIVVPISGEWVLGRLLLQSLPCYL